MSTFNRIILLQVIPSPASPAPPSAAMRHARHGATVVFVAAAASLLIASAGATKDLDAEGGKQTILKLRPLLSRNVNRVVSVLSSTLAAAHSNIVCFEFPRGGRTPQVCEARVERVRRERLREEVVRGAFT